MCSNGKSRGKMLVLMSARLTPSQQNMRLLSQLDAPDNVVRTQLGLTEDVYEQLMSCFGGDSAKLESYIKPLAEGFAVTDEASRRALSALGSQEGLSSWAFVRTYFTTNYLFNLDLTKDLISLGMDLSGQEVHELLTKLPIVLGYLWPVLLRARVDVDRPFHHSTKGRTTLRNVYGEQCSEVGRVASAQGPTITLAQLACDGDFYAVLSLIRRDAVTSLSEFHEKYLGRTVLEWARFYGRDLLAKELVFRFPFLAKESDSEPSTAAATEIKTLRDTMHSLQQKLDALANENQTLKQELARTKEHLALRIQNVGSVGRTVSGLT